MEDAPESHNQQPNEKTFVIRRLVDRAIQVGVEKRKAPYDEDIPQDNWNRLKSATDNHLLRMSSIGR
jgi:hypothetical protein